MFLPLFTRPAAPRPATDNNKHRVDTNHPRIRFYYTAENGKKQGRNQLIKSRARFLTSDFGGSSPVFASGRTLGGTPSREARSVPRQRNASTMQRQIQTDALTATSATLCRAAIAGAAAGASGAVTTITPGCIASGAAAPGRSARFRHDDFLLFFGIGFRRR